MDLPKYSARQNMTSSTELSVHWCELLELCMHVSISKSGDFNNHQSAV